MGLGIEDGLNAFRRFALGFEHFAATTEGKRPLGVKQNTWS